MNPVDPYARLSHTRHWIASPSPKKQNHYTKKKQLSQPITTTTTTVITGTALRKEKRQNVFNAETLDTFCFHWPDMHSYVLVRVLEKTIAILPVRSRLAFLYFHHAPIPSHPSPRELRKALEQQEPLNRSSSKRIQGMFKSWKHTLAFDHDDMIEEEEEEEEQDTKRDTPINSATTNTPLIDTPPSTPKANANVTLSDVLSYEPNLTTGWIHAPCTVKDDKNIFDNVIVLTTNHTVLKLTSRCFNEKMMFMNLVKLKHSRRLIFENDDDEEDDLTIVEGSDFDNASASDVYQDEEKNKKDKSMTSTDVITHLHRKTTCQLQNIHQLTVKLNVVKKDIFFYTQELVELEHSLDHLKEYTSHVQITSFKKLLDFINRQVAVSISSFQSYQARVSAIQEKVLVHNTFLTDAIQRVDQLRHRVRNYACYPWFYTSISGIVLVFSMLLGYYFYVQTSVIM